MIEQFQNAVRGRNFFFSHQRGCRKNKGVGRKISRGEENTKKDPNNSEKD